MSGMPHFTFREIAKHSSEICHVATPNADWLLYCSKAVLRRVGITGIDPIREGITARTYSYLIKRRIKAFNPDIIFAALASPMIAYLKTECPIVYFSDATFASLVDYYPEFSNLSQRAIRRWNRIEANALEKAKIILLPSQWAADTAVINYKIDPAKIFVVPIGANINSPPVVSFESGDWFNVCRLLFVGVEWERKGGDLVLAVLVELLRRGVRAELHIVGCNPPAGRSHPLMYSYGFLSKTSASQRLADLFSHATFLIVPSRQEAYGIVFAEASAFGTPSLATRTGGIPGVVQQEVNGFLFGLDAVASDYADKICEVWGNQAAYMAVRRSSHQYFLDALNWTVWGDRVEEIIRRHC
jgi:glycosyltransferase involved in cell wall biosynthesis